MSETHQDRERKTDVKVGAFVTAGIVLFVISLFIIGQERHLFETPVYLRAELPNVSGLKVGAPVRLAGVDVGIVSAITFPELPKTGSGKQEAEIGLSEDCLESGCNTPGSQPTLNWGRNTQVPLVSAEPIPLAMGAHISIVAKDPRNRFDMRFRVTGIEVNGSTEEVTEDIRVQVVSNTRAETGQKVFKQVNRIDVISAGLFPDMSGGEEDTDAGAGEKKYSLADPTVQIFAGRMRKVSVRLRIASDVLSRVRYDSVARVESMGLLGDKYIEVSLGSEHLPAHKDGDMISSEAPLDLTTLLNDAKHTVETTIDDIGQGLQSVGKWFQGDEGGGKKLLEGINSVIASFNSKGGMIAGLIGKKPAEDFGKSLAALRSDLEQIDAVLLETRTGDGVLHELIYGAQGEATITAAKDALQQAEQILEDVRTKEGVVHNLIYEEDNGAFIKNLNDATSDIKKASADVQVLIADVKAGKGTLGALIADETVYEDLKILLGNVKRNEALKALVRYSISQEEKKVTPGPKKGAKKAPK